jgi:hypothetical protein
MAEYDNTNRGVLFKNDRKEKDTHPDYTGSGNVDGVDVYINGWKKESNGKNFISFSFKRKDAAKPAVKAAPKQRVHADLDDEVPF